jgi:hypothetical protein
MVFNATFNNISVISCMVVSFIGGGNRSIRKKTTELLFPPPIKLTTMHDITEILLKVALNTITLILSLTW